MPRTVKKAMDEVGKKVEEKFPKGCTIEELEIVMGETENEITKDIAEEENLEFWNSVCTTNPKYAKAVGFGGFAFTAISAQYQIREATRKWGMLGQGWGVKVEDVSNSILVDPSLSALMVTIWYKDEEGNKCYGVPIIASAPKLRGEKADDDVFKKITTDGMTKGLSYFGFNADVFLGKFDDNKYVQKMEEKYKDTIELTDEYRAEAIGKIRKFMEANPERAVKMLDHYEISNPENFTNEQILEVITKVPEIGGAI